MIISYLSEKMQSDMNLPINLAMHLPGLEERKQSAD